MQLKRNSWENKHQNEKELWANKFLKRWISMKSHFADKYVARIFSGKFSWQIDDFWLQVKWTMTRTAITYCSSQDTWNSVHGSQYGNNAISQLTESIAYWSRSRPITVMTSREYYLWFRNLLYGIGKVFITLKRCSLLHFSYHYTQSDEQETNHLGSVHFDYFIELNLKKDWSYQRLAVGSSDPTLHLPSVLYQC